MNKLVGRKASLIRMHQTTLLGNMGNSKNTVSTTTKKVNDTDLTVFDAGVLIQYRADRSNRLTEYFVPWGNIIAVELLPDVEVGLDVTENSGSKLVTAKAK